jgi:hypothetical protein
MTVGTFADLGIMLALLEMADKTCAFSDGYVFTLDNLGMTACAPELFASFQISKVNFVIKDYFFIFHQSFQEPFFMASFAKTAFIRNFSPRL